MQHQDLCQRQREVTLNHIYRKANCTADYLANFGHSCEFGFRSFDSLDRGISHWFRCDAIDVSFSSSVSVLNNN
ncbi:hypothetical protein LINGRAPRIM_LOCUS2575 [Linum grandiflorum]